MENQFEEIREKIKELDLEQVKSQLVRDKNWDIDFINAVEETYKCFLYLAVKDPDFILLTPTDDIIDMWQAHILNTRKYIDDCEEIYGCVLHHFPDIRHQRNKADNTRTKEIIERELRNVL